MLSCGCGPCAAARAATRQQATTAAAPFPHQTTTPHPQTTRVHPAATAPTINAAKHVRQLQSLQIRSHRASAINCLLVAAAVEAAPAAAACLAAVRLHSHSLHHYRHRHSSPQIAAAGERCSIFWICACRHSHHSLLHPQPTLRSFSYAVVQDAA